jgi:hypothetical protein
MWMISGSLIFGASLAAFLVLWTIRATQRTALRRATVIEMLLVLVAGIAVGMLFGLIPVPGTSPGVSKGDGKVASEISVAVLAAVYTGMISGMLAQHLYSRFSVRKEERPAFDTGLFVAPVLVSPIIFLPILQTLGEASLTGKGILAGVLVAFQNGFFFKGYFDEKRNAQTKHAVPAQ